MRLTFVFCLISIFAIGQPQYPRGLVWEDARYDSLPLKAAQAHPADLPATATIRNYFPRVVNQSSFVNNAAAWSLAWYAMTALENRNTKDLSNKESGFAPAFTYRRAVPNDRGCQTPVSLVTALNSMVNDGLPRYSTFDTFCADSIPPVAFDSAHRHRLSGYVKLFNTFEPKDFKVRAVKEALAAGDPVVIGMICPPSFSLATEFWQPREEPDPEQGGHVVCITAYDDNRYGGAFQVVNSWGVSWGTEGYTWIRYDDFFLIAKYGFELYLTRGPLSGILELKGEEVTALGVKGTNGHYRITAPLRTGDKLQLLLATGADAFGALLFIDANESATQLFPTAGTHSKLIVPDITLPDRGRFYTLTRPAGPGRFILIMAISQFDLESLVSTVMKGTGPHDFMQIDPMIVFDSTRVRFAAKAGSQIKAVVVMVDFEQE